jgi:Endonuclease-reverse transcriptase
MATFMRKEVTMAMTVMPASILEMHYSISITVTPTPTLPPITFINFYHHIDDRKNPCLKALLATHMLTDQCLLLCGDFNMHLLLWSPGNLCPSPWASAFEDWMETENLFSLVPDRAITRQQGSDKPLLIDLMIGNPGFLEVPSFPSSCLVSFDESLGSDHASLILLLPLSFEAPPSNLHGWRITDNLHDEWIARFYALTQPSTCNVVVSSHLERGVVDHGTLRLAVENLGNNVWEVCSALFAQQKANPQGLAWWNDSCCLAVAGLSGTHGEACYQAYVVLHTTIHGAWPSLHDISISEVDERSDDAPEISYQRWECLHYGVCSEFRVCVDPLIVVFSLNCC